MNDILLEELKKIKESKYNFSEINVLELTYKLLEHIGIKDGVRRDEFVYPVLAHLLHDDVLENNELDKIANILITDDYLFYDIANEKEYSVLKRSFTLLQLAVLVYKYNKDNVLEENTYNNIVAKFYDYFVKETDLRGYEKEVGWCHSIAHSADLFAQIFNNEKLGKTDIEKGFLLIREKFVIKSYQYISDEDERMVNAIENAVKRNVLNENFILEWVEGFKDYEKGNLYPEAYTITLNVKKFLRSMYFRFLEQDEYKYISDKCFKILKEYIK